eukprot:747849-Hanusia_phi.AAC.1
MVRIRSRIRLLPEELSCRRVRGREAASHCRRCRHCHRHQQQQQHQHDLNRHHHLKFHMFELPHARPVMREKEESSADPIQSLPSCPLTRIPQRNPWIRAAPQPAREQLHAEQAEDYEDDEGDDGCDEKRMDRELQRIKAGGEGARLEAGRQEAVELEHAKDAESAEGGEDSVGPPLIPLCEPLLGGRERRPDAAGQGDGAELVSDGGEGDDELEEVCGGGQVTEAAGCDPFHGEFGDEDPVEERVEGGDGEELTEVGGDAEDQEEDADQHHEDHHPCEVAVEHDETAPSPNVTLLDKTETGRLCRRVIDLLVRSLPAAGDPVGEVGQAADLLLLRLLLEPLELALLHRLHHCKRLLPRLAPLTSQHSTRRGIRCRCLRPLAQHLCCVALVSEFDDHS